MLRTPQMRERLQAMNALCKTFEPVMYDVAAAY
jgi:hypothetical protein